MFQVYPENIDQRELILNAAMHAGFAGGIVVDFPHRYEEIYCYVNLFHKKNCVGKLFYIL